jgi:hypothetical protein
MLDSHDANRIGRLRPDARQNERAVVGVDPDIETDDEIRGAQPPPCRRVRRTVKKRDSMASNTFMYSCAGDGR